MKKQTWKYRSCPNCNLNLHVESSKVTSSPSAETLEFDSVKDFFQGFRKNQIFFSYYRCAKCNLLFNPYYFTDSQIKELYKSMPENLLGQKETGPLKTQLGYAKIIDRWVSAKNYLELGADIGLLAKSIVKMMKIENAVLIEPNTAVHTKLKSNMGSEISVEILTNLPRELRVKPDLITMVHVLDHLSDPRETLENVHKVSSPSARLAIVVHNEKSLLRHILSSKWPPFCLQHPQIFNDQTVSYLLEQTGWRVVRIARTTNHFQIDAMLKSLLRILGIKINLTQALPATILPFRTGNIMVIAEKKLTTNDW